ncbi:thiamine pyrophosphate-binding protein [Photobacterium damselae]|uniref:thiamine pyrophosphate-binding protein n=1 Tax=Photobacterium damselae TaxID=38293 RepID=UPI001EFEE6B4|nr:thiamine pyrophosphate-binding protein [Photobacterium damselae]MCG9706188.1 thiamine pyrophosphate-binding protein [Photobacterium damselae]
MKAADAVAKLLSLNNVTVGFELIGGMIAHLVDSINELGETKLISLHHEQSAAFAAGGVARATNNKQLGVALGTSGPGATNLITGIADCWLDNYPCIFITGQVNSYELKGNRNIRQQGFQELDIVSLTKTITKYAVRIETIDELLPELQKAINISKSDRPGPVLIDIPMNFQREEIDISLDDIKKLLPPSRNSYGISENIEKDFLKVNELIQLAKKPLFLVGGGACSEANFTEWQNKISKLSIPHVASLKGSEKVSKIDGYLGMVGAYGTRAANIAIQEADLLIVLGSRLDIRQTGVDVKDFARNSKNIVQIDIDDEQLNNRVKVTHSIKSSCGDFFEFFLQSNIITSSINWFNNTKNTFESKFIDEYLESSFSPFEMCKVLSSLFENRSVHFLSDVGNHQMWLAHSLLLDKKQMIHHSGGLGAMGFSLPTAIGIQCVSDALVVSVSGDGGFQLNIQELDVIRREQLPILIIVLNNCSLGMVKNFQDMYFSGRNKPTYWNGYSPSFTAIGKAYGIESYEVSSINNFEKVIKDYIKNPRSVLIEVLIANDILCKPRLTFGKPLDEQYPND